MLIMILCCIRFTDLVNRWTGVDKYIRDFSSPMLAMVALKAQVCEHSACRCISTGSTPEDEVRDTPSMRVHARGGLKHFDLMSG